MVKKTALQVDYYTDILCIWAWIAQRRLDELEQHWDQQIEVHHHFVNLFGDTAVRIGERWSAKGGFAGFGQHVLESAEPYDMAPVSADVWSRVRPKTSANAHLVLKAARLAASEEDAESLTLAFRKAFFVDALDIGRLPVLYELAESAGHDVKAIRMSIRDGSAIAALASDYQRAHTEGIVGSPSWVMDGGRQKLYGNVGYRVLNANVEGLLTKRADDASWC